MLSSALLALVVHVPFVLPHILPLASTSDLVGARQSGGTREPAHQESETRDWEQIRCEVDAQVTVALVLALDEARDLIARCDQAGAFTERNRLCHFVLQHDADDRRARKALGFKKRKGAWVPGSAKVVVDTCSGAETQMFSAERIHLSTNYLKVAGGAVIPFGRPEPSRELAYLINLNMSHVVALIAPTTDQAAFEMSFDSEAQVWLSLDAVEARIARADRQKFVEALDEGAGEPKSTDLDEGAAATGVEFRSTVQLGHVVVSSVSEGSDAVALAHGMHTLSALAGRELYERFGRTYPGTEQTEILYDLGTGEDVVAFASGHPEYDGIEPERIFGSTGFGVQYSFVFGEGLSSRLGDAVSMYGYSILSFGYGGVYGVGWVQDGLMNYLAFQASGATTTGSFVNLSGEVEPALAEEMFAEGADWLVLATREFSGGVQGTSLRTLFATEMRDLTPSDSLLAYLFAAYLLDARPRALIEILDGWSASSDRGALVEEQLNLPLRWLDEHMVEWALGLERP